MGDGQGTSISADAQPERSVLFGPIDASAALVEARTVSALNATPTGDFRFDFSHSSEIVDYFGELSFSMSHMGKSWPIFTGSVTDAMPTSDGVNVHALGAQQLRENVVSTMVVHHVPPPEMIYVLARGSGIRQERLQISGLEHLPTEMFVVTVPLDGVTTDHLGSFADVEFLPEDSGALGGLGVGEVLQTAFTAPAYARASVEAAMMLDAEERGLAKIDLALAWLTVQLRCGAAVLWSGRPVPFDRQESLAQPSRRDLVSVRGAVTGRHWLRRPEMANQERSVRLSDSARLLGGSLPSLTLQERRAILALGRAAREPDLLAQVHSLWEAIEFYCSGISLSPLFSPNQLAGIIASLPEMPSQQRERAIEMIGQLNSAPLRVRLNQAIKIDGVQVTDGEINILWKLRKLRNDVVHGRRSELPIREDVQYATSVVARILMYRIARLSQANPGQT